MQVFPQNYQYEGRLKILFWQISDRTKDYFEKSQEEIWHMEIKHSFYILKVNLTSF